MVKPTDRSLEGWSTTDQPSSERLVGSAAGLQSPNLATTQHVEGPTTLAPRGQAIERIFMEEEKVKELEKQWAEQMDRLEERYRRLDQMLETGHVQLATFRSLNERVQNIERDCGGTRRQSGWLGSWVCRRQSGGMLHPPQFGFRVYLWC